jgi:hypothetical protein
LRNYRPPLPLQLKQPQTIILGGCLTLFLVNLGSNRFCALGPPVAEALVPKSEFKMALIAELELLSLLDSLVGMLSDELQPVVFILSLIRGLSAIFLKSNCSQ